MKAAIYARVSTVDKGQNVEVQIEPLREWVQGLGYTVEIFQEAGVSGAQDSRPVLDALRTRIRRREFDALAAWKLDRISRSLQHTLLIVEELKATGTRLLVHDIALDTGTPQGMAFLQISGVFAELERNIIAERTRDGMAYAKAHGTKSGAPIGRPPITTDLMTIVDALKEVLGQRGAITRIASRFDVSRAWLYANVVPLLDASETPRPKPGAAG